MPSEQQPLIGEQPSMFEHCAAGVSRIAGPAGALEVQTSCPGGFKRGSPIAVVCHPHPLHGGSLKNKVVHTLVRSFMELGAMAVSFNFRGVGGSEGSYDHGKGEGEDLQAVVHHLRCQHPASPLWLAGFSFGAWVALHNYQRVGAERLLLVAPPLGLFSFAEAPGVDVPWLVVQGDKDEVVEPAQVAEWLRERATNSPVRPQLRWMSDANHYFDGQLNRLREAVVGGWQRLDRFGPDKS